MLIFHEWADGTETTDKPEEKPMKKLMLSALAFFVFAAVAVAQDIPAADVAGGYSFLKVVKGSSLTAEGGSGSVALNFNNWLGAVSDFALYHSSVIGPGWRRGRTRLGRGFPVQREVCASAGRKDKPVVGIPHSAEENLRERGHSSPMTIAGRFALRPQAEYSGFWADGATTNTVRLSIGVVLRIGRKSV